MSIANIYAGIVKMDDNGDGTLTVYGKATDDTLDIDQQICDPVWLDRAMPEWFTTGGNIREQHSNIAAGVAEEYEKKADGHYITALVVDPVSVKKVKARVLKGFSIGIKSPRVVRDQKAANGRIIDGQIVEVSLVDRPANPNAKLVLAKSAEGQPNLVKTEQFFEKHGDHDQADHGNRDGGGSDNNESERDSADNPRDMSVDRDNSVSREMGSDMTGVGDGIRDLESELINSSPGGIETQESESCAKAEESVIRAVNALEEATNADDMGSHIDSLQEAYGHLDDANDFLSDVDHGDAEFLSDRIGQAMMDLEEYLQDLESNDDGGGDRFMSSTPENKKLKESRMARKSRAAKSAKAKEADGMPMNGEAKAVPSRDEMVERYASARKALDEITAMCKEYGYSDIEKQYGETAEEETAEGPSVSPETAQEEVQETQGEKPLDKELVSENGNEELKSVTKCLECGCNMPGQSHGNPNVSTAVMVSPDQTPVPTPAIQPPTPKSVGTIVPPSTIEEVGTIIEEEDSDEDNSAEKSLLADVDINGIVEKAVKSAIASVEAQVAELKSAKEAVENKAATLESELATAKSLAIGGGPKRTTMATGANTTNEWRAKADLYFAKAANTTDNDLAKGYREMAKDFLAKADTEVKA